MTHLVYTKIPIKEQVKSFIYQYNVNIKPLHVNTPLHLPKIMLTFRNNQHLPNNAPLCREVRW